MSRKKSISPKRKTKRPRRRRSRANAMAHFVRGVVVEGMGVAALVMLYVTIQSTSADGVLEKGEQRLVGVETKSNQAAELQGPQLPSWVSESTRNSTSTFNNGYVYNNRDVGNNNARRQPAVDGWR